MFLTHENLQNCTFLSAILFTLELDSTSPLKRLDINNLNVY